VLNILVLDIETCPGEAYVWSQKDQFVPLERLKRPGHIISIGWRWMGRGTVQYADAWPFDNAASRRRMLEQFHAALSQADAIVTYNGKSFDMPRINGEFVLFGLPPLPKRPHIDLYQHVRGLGFWSGKLEYVLKHLEEGTKGSTGGFGLWRGYMEGNEKCRKRMRTYCRRDVGRTAGLYKRVRPYMTSHPRLHDHPACPYCGSKRTQARGFRRLEFYKVQRHACMNQKCKGWFEGRRSKI
jgi:DNA polymerase elongation subunit (family B)